MADHVEVEAYVPIFARAISECYFRCSKTCDFDHCQVSSNSPFARSGHMVRNKLCWDANYAVRPSKQRNCHQSSPTLLKHGLNMSFFTTCKGFQLSINHIIVIPLSNLLLLHSLRQDQDGQHFCLRLFLVVGSIERRFMLIRSWAGVAKASYGAFLYSNRLGMHLVFFNLAFFFSFSAV